MPKNFKLPIVPKLAVSALPFAALKDTQVRIRLALGTLLVANLVAAGFAFHFFDDSPDQLARQVQSTRQQTLATMVKLNHTRALAAKVGKGREEGVKFISTYMTTRREAYSTIISEVNAMATSTGMKIKDGTTGLDAIQGTDSMDMMTITRNFEGDYKSLLSFINQIDRSKLFLIIDSITATPQQDHKLQVVLKLNAFIRDDHAL